MKIDSIQVDAELIDDVLEFLGDQADYSDEGGNLAGRLYSRLETERHEAIRKGCVTVVHASAVTVAPEALTFERRAWGA